MIKLIIVCLNLIDNSLKSFTSILIQLRFFKKLENLNNY